jgi:hypothetical protein
MEKMLVHDIVGQMFMTVPPQRYQILRSQRRQTYHMQRKMGIRLKKEATLPGITIDVHVTACYTEMLKGGSK